MGAISHNTRIRLTTAAVEAFPDGSVSPGWLRAQHRKGRLEIWRIAGKDYTTLEAIEKMIDQCRVPPNLPDSTFESERGESRSTSSSTGEMKSALAAAQEASERLKQSSRATSRASTPPDGATVIRLKSR